MLMHFTLATAIAAFTISATAAPKPAGQGAGLAIPITEHPNLLNPDKTINIDALDSQFASVEAILGSFDIYENNTGTKPPSAMEGIRKRANSVHLTYAEPDWYGTISVGTPAQIFTVVFSTGSSATVLPDSLCLTCRGHTLWYHSLSSSARHMNEEFSLTHGPTGKITGLIYDDTISIADLTLPACTIGAAMFYSTSFTRAEFAADGLVGLSLGSVAVDGSILHALINKQRIAELSFSFKLSSPGAELYIGGSNSELYSGEFTYVPVTSDTFWLVTMDNIQSDAQMFWSNIPVIIDTSTPFIHGTPSQVFAMHTALGSTYIGKGSFAYQCDSMPTFSLRFGGTSFQIPPSILNVGPVPDKPLLCASGLVSLTYDAVYWIIGGVFLKNVYTKFDVHNAKIGFAQLL